MTGANGDSARNNSADDHSADGGSAATESAVLAAPPIRLARGTITPEETAALVAVLSAAAAAAGGEAPEPKRSQWSARARSLRQPLMAGSGGWRASALPR